MLNFKDVYCDTEGSKFCINNITDILLFRIHLRLIRPIALPVSLIETKCLSFLNEQQFKWKLFIRTEIIVSNSEIQGWPCIKKLVLVQIRSLEKIKFDLYTSLIEIIQIIYLDLHIIALFTHNARHR